MKKILAILALVFAMFSASAQVTVWSNGNAIYNSNDQKVDSVSFKKLSKSGSTTTTNTPTYKEVKPTYLRSNYSGFCNVIVGSIFETSTSIIPGATNTSFNWVEIYDHNGKLIESTDEWVGVYQVPHFGYIIPYFFNGTRYNKITVGQLDKLKIYYKYTSGFYIEY